MSQGKCTLVLWLAVLASFTGCGKQTPVPAAAPSYGQAATELRPISSPRPAAAATLVEDAPLVVFLGDSLSAGLGLEEEEAFPARVAALLAQQGRPIRAVNAGISGDTSAGGLARLDWLLRQKPDVMVVELGANDGLRGQPVGATETNLRAITARSQAAGAKVLLVGIQVPPNYGPEYARDFAAIFPRIADELKVPLLPFLLAGVAGDPTLNLADGLHPTATGHERIAATLLPYLKSVLDTVN